MKPKTIVTVVLLLFVAAGLAYVVVGESRSAGTSPNPQPAPSAAASQQPDEAKIIPHKVVAYYFHGNIRCITCKTIEAYAREAITTNFADELGSGLLEMRVINVDEPANEHFIQDYQLTTRSLVLSDVIDGKQKRWKNLDQVWTLVRDKDNFVAYVHGETLAYLAGEDPNQ